MGAKEKKDEAPKSDVSDASLAKAPQAGASERVRKQSFIQRFR